MTSPRKVVVLDYGSGNLRSASRALQRVGADTEVTADSDAALAADGLVVPGVGAFAACMAGLREVRGEEIIAKRLAGGRPVLGICVGMQILFARGLEHGTVTAGCGAWPGDVVRLDAPIVPHMGWNTVQAPGDSRLFAGIDPGERFYFVHSYAATTWESEGRGAAWTDERGSEAEEGGGKAAPSRGQGRWAGTLPSGGSGGSSPRASTVTWATHGQRFVAAVEDGPLCATQFHPEKSGDAGAALLSNWLEAIS